MIAETLEAEQTVAQSAASDAESGAEVNPGSENAPQGAAKADAATPEAGKSEDVAETTELVLFQDAESGEALPVIVDQDTVWMTQAQMSRVFEVGVSTVSEHLSNAYAAGEVERPESMREMRVARQEGGRRVSRALKHYNLDAILSVGYRVSSKRGARFRRWATSTLRERMMEEVAARRRAHEGALKELSSAIELATSAMEKAAGAGGLTDEARAVLAVVDRYARSFTLLLQYDEDRLPTLDGGEAAMVSLGVDSARAAIAQLKARLAERGEDTDLFGQEREGGLEPVLAGLEQTFGGEALYPSWRARAAHLLYFVIKNHPFSDGNKRIGSFLFLRYLDLQGRLNRSDGSPRVDDAALVAIALLVAESAPAQRDLVIRLILGLISEES